MAYSSNAHQRPHCQALCELSRVCRFISPHRGSAPNDHDDDDTYLMMRPVYTTEYAESVRPKHKIPEKVYLLPHCRRDVCLLPRKGPGLDQGYLCGIFVELYQHLLAEQSCLGKRQSFHGVKYTSGR